MHLGDHLVEVGEHLLGLEPVSASGHSTKFRVGLHNADDFDLRAVLVWTEESMNMAVNQADDSDTKRGVGLRRLGKRGSSEAQRSE
jgi:hypothetical protein